MLRITGGEFRSRLLVAPNSEATKPTMDRVRAGVFSALGSALIDASILDLYAGSGSYSFESLSRGASFAVAVENDQNALLALTKNAQTLGVMNRLSIIANTVDSFLKETTQQFDIIFLDPPYVFSSFNEIIKMILDHRLLTDFGIIVIESNRELDIVSDAFTRIKRYAYGYAKIYILRK